MLAMSFGLDDMKAAYRMIPVLQAWFTVFAVWNAERDRVEFFYMPGHNFGFRSAVLNFNAYAKLVATFARAFLAVMCDQYFDDFMIVDVASAGRSAQHALAASLSLIGGQRHEPSKRKHMGGVHVGLGIQVDVSMAHTKLMVSASPAPGRVESVLQSLRLAKDANYLSPDDAASVHGKLGFIFSSAYYRFGRAALQPLQQRQHYDLSFEFTPALCEALDFLAVVLPNLPPLEMRLVAEKEPPLVVYTDAMFEWTMGSRPWVPVLRIGFVVFDPVTGHVFYSCYQLPLWYFTEVFAPDLRTYIAQGEAVGALAPLLSMPQVFKGRSVIQFQDNTWALSALIHGYASRPDMGRVVNAFHVAHFTLRARIWLEWVPSAANIADLPSRFMIDALRARLPQVVYVPTILPGVEQWRGSLAAMASSMISYISSVCD